MSGPKPAGRPWTRAEEHQLRELIATGVKVGSIARKLKRSPGAIYARINSLKKGVAGLRVNRANRKNSAPSRRVELMPDGCLIQFYEDIRRQVDADRTLNAHASRHMTTRIQKSHQGEELGSW